MNQKVKDNSQIDPDYLSNDPITARSPFWRGTIKIALSLAMVVSGMLVGLAAGLFVGIGSCLKSDCNVVVANAHILLPAASLLFTTPACYFIIKDD